MKRYLRNNRWAKNATSEQELKKFRSTVGLFKKYAARYEFDWLIIMAQAYQESGLDQNVHSRTGAVGVMQLLPSTAAGPPINVEGIDNVENNIHAGVKYLRFIVDEYFDDGEINDLNKTLFAFAAYNGGPNRIVRLREEAAEQGLDPNRWFKNVELLAARQIGREVVQYVSNIYKYYVAYRLITEREQARPQAAD